MLSSALVTTRRLGARPPAGARVRINWRHPLARSLVFAVPWSAGAGAPNDVTDRTVTTVTGSIPWKSTLRGVGGDHPGTAGNFVSWGNPAHLHFSDSTPFSLFAMSEIGGAEATERRIISKDLTSGSPRRFYLMYLAQSTNKLGFFLGRIGDSVTLETAAGVNAGVRTFGAVWRPAASQVASFLDGALAASAAYSPGAGSWNVNVGDVMTARSDGASSWKGQTLLHYVFNTALTDEHFRLLHSDPWGLFDFDQPPLAGLGAPTFDLDFALPLPFEILAAPVVAIVFRPVLCGRAFTPTEPAPLVVADPAPPPPSGAQGSPGSPQVPTTPVNCGRGMTPFGYDPAAPPAVPAPPALPPPPPPPLPPSDVCAFYTAKAGATLDGNPFPEGNGLLTPTDKTPSQVGGGPDDSFWIFWGFFQHGFPGTINPKVDRC